MTPPPLPDGAPAIARWRSMGPDLWLAELADGEVAIVKRTPYLAAVEVDGLEALRRAGAPVPQVLAAGERVLLLERVEGPADWEALGRSLAAVHGCTSEAFGWHRDNAIGPLEQRNTRTPEWAEFYAEHRLRPHLDAPALPAELRQRLARGIDGPLRDLLGRPRPSLIHGDLWSGNVVGGRWLIDPAVCYADREHELAFMHVFGGFPRQLFAAYAEAWPLADGWRARRPALQLYHLLVHVRLFGAGYVGAVADRLTALGW